MVSTVCIFEDPQYANLLPLTYTRPVYDLRCGILTLREKIQRAYPKVPTTLLCRPYLADVVKQQNPGISVNELHTSASLFINGRVLADEDFAKRIPLKGEDAIYLSGNTVVAVRSGSGRQGSAAHDFSEAIDAEHFGELPRIPVDVPLIEYPWHLVNRNGEEIARDVQRLLRRAKGKGRLRVHAGVHFVNKKDIHIADGAVIKPGVVLDAEGGPIYIGQNAVIMPNAVIEGPAFIGAGTLVKVGAKIYGNTSIGERCKVGGEVEASIIHSYSNKQHDGFLGHSYLGMWCNLGADTNTSDLKNNYGTVRVFINGKEVDSGSQFVGLTMGDHSKSGINTMFNTGTVVGVSSNVFGAGFPPKFIPSFAWGGAEGLDTYDLEKSLSVARRVMERRNVTMTEADELLLRKIFDLTRKERARMRSEQEKILIPSPFVGKKD
jgi:UDP-N-acetylglucosamine diphosphorylase/glucosamine-1-phosphate N-acetyltransferase